MKTDANTKYILHELYLEPIIISCMDEKEGYGWTEAYAMTIATEYRRFLVLCALADDGQSVVPCVEVDNFWHKHILDTQKYREDCEKCFGKFMDHFPYFGTRGKEDAADLRDSFSATIRHYQQVFGSLDTLYDIWTASNRCPKCGKRNGNDIRPTLEMRA